MLEQKAGDGGRKAILGHRMGEKSVINMTRVAALSILIGSGAFATVASAQSFTDKLKGLFGGGSKPEELPPVDPGEAQPDLTCPQVTIRYGASTYAVAAPGKQPVGNDVRYQATITKLARDCTRTGGDSEKVIATKAYRTTVNMAEDESAPFTFVAEDLVYPAPGVNVADKYIFYVGFDPQLASADKPKPARKKK